MARRLCRKIGGSFLLAALAAILVFGGILGACSRAPSTTTTTASTTTTSTSMRTTTSAPATTTTSAPATTTTSAPAPTGVSAADFFKSNVVTVVVPYAPGGTIDYAARLMASYWTEYTGGRMLVDNRAGAGGVTATNYVYASKADGLTLGVHNQGSMLTPALTQDPAVKFDVTKMGWIGFMNSESYSVGISPKAPYSTIQDFAKQTGLKFASSGKSNTASLSSALIIESFGLKGAKIVLGYGGASEALLAVAKGESDAYITTNAVLQDGINKGLTKKPVVAVDVERSSYFPDTPALSEAVKLPPELQTLLTAFAAFKAGQVFWYRPGVPQDRIDFVRSVFDKMTVNENFVKQAKTVWPIWEKPVSGKDYAAQMEKVLSVATAERVNAMAALADKYY